MISVVVSLLMTLRTWTRSRAALQLEVLALRHQLQVLQRSWSRRLRLAKADRCLWVLLPRLWTGWRTALLDKDTPIPRPVTPPGDGVVVAIPEVGGLHHRYERHAA